MGEFVELDDFFIDQLNILLKDSFRESFLVCRTLRWMRRGFCECRQDLYLLELNFLHELGLETRYEARNLKMYLNSLNFDIKFGQNLNK